MNLCIFAPNFGLSESVLFTCTELPTPCVLPDLLLKRKLPLTQFVCLTQPQPHPPTDPRPPRGTPHQTQTPFKQFWVLHKLLYSFSLVVARIGCNSNRELIRSSEAPDLGSAAASPSSSSSSCSHVGGKAALPVGSN